MTEETFFSLVVTPFKNEEYIEQCVESILSQNYKNFEIIIVDDLSPDRCYEICKKKYGNLSNVCIAKHKESLGIGPQRNTGLHLARGEYVFFIDGDDMIKPPDSLSIINEVVKKCPADVISSPGWLKSQDSNGGVIKKDSKFTKIPCNIIRADEPVALKIDMATKVQTITQFTLWAAICHKAFRREYLETNKIEFPHINFFATDFLFHIATLLHADTYALIPDFFLIWRQHDSTSKMNHKNIDFLGKLAGFMIEATEYINYHTKSIPFFNENPIQVVKIRETYLDWVVNEIIFSGKLYENYLSEDNYEIEKIVKSELEKYFPQHADFVSYLFHRVNLFYRLSRLQQK